jgi:hypothetical protein
MTWHTQTVTAEALAFLLARIKAVGGTIAHSRPGPGGVQVTWTTMTSDLTLKDDAKVVAQLEQLVDTMDTLTEDPAAYAARDLAFHDTIMRASGNRIARAMVRALESQVVNTARYVGEIRPDLCAASNRGHRAIYERIAAHHPDGAAQAMFQHITEAWVVRRGGPGEPVRIRR